MATTYLTRTSGTPTNALKWTFSAWVKNSQVGTGTFLLDFNTDTNNRSQIGFESNGCLTVYEKVSGSTSQLFQTNALYRDLSGWYNFVISCDRTLGTAADRTKIYVNGVRETSFSASDNPAQNTNGIINTAVNTLIGKYSQSGVYFNGLLSHVHFVDGTAYPASTFGSTDSTTGEWEINTSPTVTYGNNGFFILKNDNVINDQSGNANNFTLGGGTLTKTEDCPSNVFATMNRASPTTVSLTNMANGNLYNGDQSPNYWQGIPGTLATSSGKIYWEFKIEQIWGTTSQNSQRHGIADIGAAVDNNTSDAYDIQWTSAAYGIGWCNTSGVRNSGSVTGTSDYSTYVVNDILMFAMDLDNLKLYLGKNGTWQNSGNPTSGASGTGAFTIPTAGLWAPYSETKYGSDKVSWNCGNGYFRTVAISPAGSPASTPGIFQYQIPTGYQPISTKGINV